MAPAEYRTLLRTLNLSQERAAVWLGVSKRTGQNYAKKGPPEPVARLLRAFVAKGMALEDLNQRGT